jgi:hypothetical protein
LVGHRYAEVDLASGVADIDRAGRLGEPERRVSEADALVQKKVLHLSQKCPPHLVHQTAWMELANLRPRLEEALEALVELERGRSLTEEEHAKRRAYRMLLRFTR